MPISELFSGEKTTVHFAQTAKFKQKVWRNFSQLNIDSSELQEVHQKLWANKYDLVLVKGTEPLNVTPKSTYQAQHPLKPEAVAGTTPVFKNLVKTGVIIPCVHSPVRMPIKLIKILKKKRKIIYKFLSFHHKARGLFQLLIWLMHFFSVSQFIQTLSIGFLSHSRTNHIHLDICPKVLWNPLQSTHKCYMQVLRTCSYQREAR